MDRALGIGGDGRRLGDRRIWWHASVSCRLCSGWTPPTPALKRLCTVGQLAGAALALGIGRIPWTTAGSGDRLGRLSVVCLGGAGLPAIPVGRAAARGRPSGGARQPAPPALPHAGVPAAIRVRDRQARLGRHDLAQPARVLLPPGDAALAHAHRLVCAPPAPTRAEGRDGVDSLRRVRDTLSGVRTSPVAPAGVCRS